MTDCYRPEERAKVQAANDFLVFGSVAIASFSSGQLLDPAAGDASTGSSSRPSSWPLLALLALAVEPDRTGPAPA